MKIIVFDTETTSRIPGKIVQLAYIIKQTGQPVVGKNFFFSVDWMSEEAQQVHGLSLKKLEELSHGDVFADHALEIEKDFRSADMVIAHNFKFDKRFMKKEFIIALKRSFTYKKGAAFDTMEYFTPIMKMYSALPSFTYKAPKLAELAMWIGVEEEDAIRMCIDIYQDGTIDFHDARFDIVLTYLCFKQAVKEHLIKLPEKLWLDD